MTSSYNAQNECTVCGVLSPKGNPFTRYFGNTVAQAIAQGNNRGRNYRDDADANNTLVTMCPACGSKYGGRETLQKIIDLRRSMQNPKKDDRK